MGSDFDHLEFAASELIRTNAQDEEFAELLVGMGYQALPDKSLPLILNVLLKAGYDSVYQIYLNFLDHELDIPAEVATIAFLHLAEDIPRHLSLVCLKIYLNWKGPSLLSDHHIRWGIVAATYGDHAHFHIFNRLFRRIGMLKHMDLMTHEVPL